MSRQATYLAFREQCELSIADFSCLRDLIQSEILKPENRIAMEGPGVKGNSSRRINRVKTWEKWISNLLENIGNQFWGPGTNQKWRFPEERLEIRKFVKKLAIYVACHQRRKVRNTAIMMSARDLYGVNTKSSSQIATNTDAKEDLSRYEDMENLGSESKHVVPTPSTDSAVGRKTFPAAPAFQDPNQQLDFVFEISLVGSREFNLVHGVDVPTLDHFIEDVCRKYGLDQNEEDITGIKVKIGDRMCNVNLDEPRDWKYISRLVVENGGRAVVIVEVAWSVT